MTHRVKISGEGTPIFILGLEMPEHRHNDVVVSLSIPLLQDTRMLTGLSNLARHRGVRVYVCVLVEGRERTRSRGERERVKLGGKVS